MCADAVVRILDNHGIDSSALRFSVQDISPEVRKESNEVGMKEQAMFRTSAEIERDYPHWKEHQFSMHLPEWVSGQRN